LITMTLVDRTTRAALNAENHVGHYGPGASRFDDEGEHYIVFDRVGVIVDHLASFEAAGGRVHVAASGALWAVLPDGRAYRVLCGEIIAVATEDGPSDGRCGLPVVPAGQGRCEGCA
jgi:hypothetical protein